MLFVCFVTKASVDGALPEQQRILGRVLGQARGRVSYTAQSPLFISKILEFFYLMPNPKFRPLKRTISSLPLTY